MRHLSVQIPFVSWFAVVATAVVHVAFPSAPAHAGERRTAGNRARTVAMANSGSTPAPRGLRAVPATPAPKEPEVGAAFTAALQFAADGANGVSAGVSRVQGTLLGWAVSGRMPRLVDGMLHVGMNPNAGGSGQLTPLMIAASSGQLEMIQMLLENGAKVDATDAKGRTPLHYAIATRKREAMEALLAANASVSSPDVVPLAMETGDWSFIEPVLQRVQSRDWDVSARLLLAQAIRGKQTAHLRLLLSKHEGAVTLEGVKDPVLLWGVVKNDLGLVRMLLEAGADPNTTLPGKPEERLLNLVPFKKLKHYLAEEPGMNVMCVAAGMGHSDMLRLLLEHGAERNRPTKSKYRLVPLYFAAWGNHARCMQTLIDNSPAPDRMRIEISLLSQEATLYKNGVPVFRTEISSGQPETPTPTGQFVITDKKRHHVSNLYDAKMPFFMRLSCKDFGMHEGHLPGYPASHGCIRLPADSAQQLFRDVPIGTLVTIR